MRESPLNYLRSKYILVKTIMNRAIRIAYSLYNTHNLRSQPVSPLPPQFIIPPLKLDWKGIFAAVSCFNNYLLSRSGVFFHSF